MTFLLLFEDIERDVRISCNPQKVIFFSHNSEWLVVNNQAGRVYVVILTLGGPGSAMPTWIRSKKNLPAREKVLVFFA